MFTKKRWQKLAGLLNEQVEYSDDSIGEETAGEGKRIVGYYESWTEEDAEIGDTDNKGELGEWSMEPDEYDLEDGLTAVDLAVRLLQDEGAGEASSSSFHPGVWYSTTDDEMDYRTGERTVKSFHLKGFTPEEEQEVFSRMK